MQISHDDFRPIEAMSFRCRLPELGPHGPTIQACCGPLQLRGENEARLWEVGGGRSNRATPVSEEPRGETIEIRTCETGTTGLTSIRAATRLAAAAPGAAGSCPQPPGHFDEAIQLGPSWRPFLPNFGSSRPWTVCSTACRNSALRVLRAGENRDRTGSEEGGVGALPRLSAMPMGAWH